MKRDISSRDDIMILVNSFYNEVKQDESLRIIFNDVAKINWETHLPKMYDFWENVIFHTGAYRGNTLKVHLNLNDLYPILAEHFERWIELFTKTVNELFEGENAQMALNKSGSISTVIRVKLANQKKEL